MSIYFLHYQQGIRSGNLYNSIFRIAHLEKGHIIEELKEIQILLKNDSIDFFYTVDNIEHPANIQRNIHLFSFPLDTIERIDHFLLNAIDIQIDIYHSSNKHHLYYSSALPEKRLLEVNGQYKLVNIQEVLLCLFNEFENHESDINKYSPEIVRQIKKKLNKSFIFTIIKKKFEFYRILFDWQESDKIVSEWELKTSFNEYLTIILNNSLDQKIPVRKLGSGNWFENPEQELEHLQKINTKYDLNSEKEEEIQNYYLTKHSVLSALKMSTGWLSKVIITLQCFSFFCFIFIWLNWLSYSYIYMSIPMVLGVVSFIISIVIVAFRQKNVNLFMPRALVSIATALFFLIGSEDIVKNQLTIDRNALIVIVIFIKAIIAVFLYTESRQHSPYYKSNSFKGLYNYKVIPVLVYSFNASLIFVLLTQLFIQDKIIEKSKVIETYSFAESFDKLENMRYYYENYSNTLNKVADEYSRALTFLLDQDVSMLSLTYDSLKINRLVSKLSSSTTNIDAVNRYLEYYADLKQKLVITDTDSIFKRDLIDRNIYKDYNFMANFKGSKLILDKNRKNAESVILRITEDYENLSKAQFAIDAINKSLMEYYYSVKKNSFLEELISFQIAPKISIANTPDYGFKYQDTHIYIYKPFDIVSEINFKGKPNKVHVSKNYITKKIYPGMMILQVMIVMLLGLVGQLIISDKTVTEPL